MYYIVRACTISLEPLISLDLVRKKLYCFRARVHCYYCWYIIFFANSVRRFEELYGDPISECFPICHPGRSRGGSKDEAIFLGKSLLQGR